MVRKISANSKFQFFFSQLQTNSQKEWSWLIHKFRQRLFPFFNRQIWFYPDSLPQSLSDFKEEIFEETLIKFYEIFKEKNFHSYSEMEATIVSIAGFKLKEALRAMKKELEWQNRKVGLIEEVFIAFSKRAINNNHLSQQLEKVKDSLSSLSPKDGQLLQRFYNGEALEDLAADMNITASACRKRKERAIQKLRVAFFL